MPATCPIGWPLEGRRRTTAYTDQPGRPARTHAGEHPRAVTHQVPKLRTRVRFSSPAPLLLLITGCFWCLVGDSEHQVCPLRARMAGTPGSSGSRWPPCTRPIQIRLYQFCCSGQRFQRSADHHSSVQKTEMVPARLPCPGSGCSARGGPFASRPVLWRSRGTPGDRPLRPDGLRHRPLLTPLCVKTRLRGRSEARWWRVREVTCSKSRYWDVSRSRWTS